MNISAFVSLVSKCTFIRESLRKSIINKAKDFSDTKRLRIANKLNALGEEILSDRFLLALPNACHKLAVALTVERERGDRAAEALILPSFDTP